MHWQAFIWYTLWQCYESSIQHGLKDNDPQKVVIYDTSSLWAVAKAGYTYRCAVQLKLETTEKHIHISVVGKAIHALSEYYKYVFVVPRPIRPCESARGPRVAMIST